MLSGYQANQFQHICTPFYNSYLGRPRDIGSRIKKKTINFLVLFFRLNVGWYSINAFRERPFTSIGSLLNTNVNITNQIGNPTLRCTALNFERLNSTFVQMNTTETGVGVVCLGKGYCFNFSITNLDFLATWVKIRNNQKYWKFLFLLTNHWRNHYIRFFCFCFCGKWVTIKVY